MTKKEVTINGKQYPVVFNMDTIILFEEITNGSFFDTQLKKTTERIALILAAIKSADEKTDINFDDIKQQQDYQVLTDILKAYVVVSELMTEFFNIPAVEDEAEKAEATQADGDTTNKKDANAKN